MNFKQFDKYEKITQQFMFFVSLFIGVFTTYVGIHNKDQITNTGFQYVSVNGVTTDFINPAIMLALMGLVLFGTGCQIARTQFNNFGDFYFTVFNFIGFFVSITLIPMFAYDLHLSGLLSNGFENYYYDVFMFLDGILFTLFMGVFLYRSIKLVLYYRDLIGNNQKENTVV